MSIHEHYEAGYAAERDSRDGEVADLKQAWFDEQEAHAKTLKERDALAVEVDQLRTAIRAALSEGSRHGVRMSQHLRAAMTKLVQTKEQVKVEDAARRLKGET